MKQMMKGTLPSGMAWMEDGGELFVRGTNAMGEKEWLVPTLGSLSKEDADAFAALGAAMNMEAEKARKCFSRGWECVVTSHENGWIDYHLRGDGEGGVEAKGRQWRPYGPRGREIDAVDGEWSDFGPSIMEYRRDILAAWKEDFGKEA